MEKKIFFKWLSIICVLVLVCGYSISTQSTKAKISSISFDPGGLNARITLEGTSPLHILNSYYAEEQPLTLVLNLEGVDNSYGPLIKAEKNQFLSGIRTEKEDPDKMKVFISLKEKVPYRYFSDQNKLFIEFNKIMTAQGKITPDEETERLIAAQAGKDIKLETLEVSEGIDRINVRAKLTGKPIPHVFALNNPTRLVVDLYNTIHSKKNTTRALKRFGVDRIRSGQFQTGNPHYITRIVFDLDKPQQYSLNTSENEVILTFFDEYKLSPPPSTSQPIKTEIITPKSQTSAPETAAVKKPSELPEPLPKESNSIPAVTPKSFQPKTEEIVPPQEHSAKPVESSSQDIYKSEDKGNGGNGHSYQEKLLPQSIETVKEPKYSGSLISPKFKDADLRDVILYLGEEAGLNVVFDPEVRGTVTCNFEDIPWDQFIDIILKTNKMGKSLEGNVLRIAPMATLTREQEELRKLEDTQELAGPMRNITFKLSYSKAMDVKALLESKLSERGEIIIDNRTNTLIVSEVTDRIGLLEDLIEALDTPTPQVSIEARIVEATSTFIRNLGIQWGWRGIADPFYGNQTSVQFPNKVFLDGAQIPEGVVTKGISGPLGGYAINLPAPAFTTVMGLSLSNVLSTVSVDMALSALETSGSGKIISAPSVVTQNNQEAEIIQGRQIPVQTIANFTVTTRYVNAALELRATPQITAEGTIIMTIDIQNNAADFANLVNGIPPITRQSAHTVVMIPDGGTTVIGGIYRTEDSITHERVPFLHKIPILGNLFRSFARTKQNRELLIFITPRILK
ncbi:MAG: type IV pilus secretin PilQ [Candidatus Aminicenantes bacterium]|nr:type IV pilus secretin PilQ [Candidatus Aminicenantes bacterium]